MSIRVVLTSQSWWNSEQRQVRKYDVHVESDKDIDTPNAEREKRPYIADTFPVTVEQQYIVVEIE